MIRTEPNIETFESVNQEFESIKKIVKSFLEIEPQTRNDDQFLIFRILQEYTQINITFEEFKKAPHFESIRRMRQKLQEENENLRADDYIEELRNKRRDELRILMNKPRGIEVF